MRESDDLSAPPDEALGPKTRAISARLCGSELLTHAERNQLQTDYWAAEIARWRGANQPVDLSWFHSAHEHRAMTAADLGLADDH